MLRITHVSNNGDQKNGKAVTLKLEGHIHAEWVTLLEHECRTLMDQEKQVRLDFSGVLYVDLNGVEMLRQLPSRQMCILNPPEFIAELLSRANRGVGGEAHSKPDTDGGAL